MFLNEEIYKDKALACWRGKNIGGTIGFPMEFDRQTNLVTDYGKAFDHPMPNDDLDIQLLWLIALEEKGLQTTAERLGEYWQRYITPHWSEYGVAKVNMRSGVVPPLSGSVNNEYYKHSNGAWIRTEIWACLAPGLPELAVQYAIKDCVIDHGDGEGSYAAMFCAAMQSIAFVNTNLDQVIEAALRFIPQDCGVARAIRGGMDCYKRKLSLEETRDYLLTHHRGRFGRSCSERDRQKHFDEGRLGYDAPLNVAMVVAGMMYGEGCFDSMIQSTIYFGEDTDCTVGTAAATYGLIYGTQIIEDKWREPIGDRIITACLNLGELGIYGDVLPATVQELTDRVFCQHTLLGMTYHLMNAGDGFDTADIDIDMLVPSAGYFENVRQQLTNVMVPGEFISARVHYLKGDCTIAPGHSATVEITISNVYKTADSVNYRWLLPEGVSVSPVDSGKLFLMFGGFMDLSEKTLSFSFTTESEEIVQRCVLELTIDGRTTSLYVPVILFRQNEEQECSNE
jgi:ADP-ribosylglycohydrolase